MNKEKCIVEVLVKLSKLLALSELNWIWSDLLAGGGCVLVLFDIAHEDVVDVLLGLLFRALGQQLGVVHFDSVDATLENTDIAKWLSHDCLLLVYGIAGTDKIRSKSVALVLSAADQHNQTFGVLALV